MTEEKTARERHRLLLSLAELGASAQSAIPGLYAWAITVAPAAWSRGAPLAAKIFALIGVIALLTAPLVEGVGRVALVRPWMGPERARIWSVWGFVLSSAIVWALAPSALSPARLDGVRGALGMVGWALFAFASAGPSMRPDEDASARIVAGTPLKPRSELPRGDGAYVVFGVVAALGMQAIGWGVVSPERAVLVRLVTIASGIAVLGGATSIALARHATRTPSPGRVRLRRALPWFSFLLILAAVGAVLTLGR